MSSPSLSPLRYPGGKQAFSGLLSQLIRLNNREGGLYAEPYAGGAGAALSLLVDEYVNEIAINDADKRVFYFWEAILTHTEAFIKMIERTPVTIDEWRNQRGIYRGELKAEPFSIGFSVFFLNRCNRSGIISNGGPIGGLHQAGPWKIDVRFNKKDLIKRIERISYYRDRIKIYNLDAIDFLKAHFSKKSDWGKSFIYLDPPYYNKGSCLYLNHYSDGDHISLAKFLRSAKFPWVLSYDRCPFTVELYKEFRTSKFTVDYSAHTKRKEKELIVFGKNLVLPRAWSKSIPKTIVS